MLPPVFLQLLLLLLSASPTLCAAAAALSVVDKRQICSLLSPSSCACGFFLPPSHSVPFALFTLAPLQPASPSLFPSLSQPVGSQTERVSRGLERGIISLLLPLRSLSLVLHLCVYPSFSSSPMATQRCTSSFSAPGCILSLDFGQLVVCVV